VFVEGDLQQSGFFPQIGGEERVSVGKSGKGGLDEISHSFGASSGRGENVLDSSHGENLLGGSGSDNSSSSGGGYQSYRYGSALSSDFSGDSVGKSDLVSPISSSDWDDSQFGGGDCSSDGSGNFLCAFNSETDVSIEISDNNESLESGSLSGSGLLLNGHNLDDFVLQFGSKEEIDDLGFFDGERKEVDFFQFLDQFGSNQSSQFGDGNPSLGFLVSSSSSSGSSSSSSISSSSSSSSSVSSSSSSSKSSSSSVSSSISSSTGRSSVSHLIVCCFS